MNGGDLSAALLQRLKSMTSNESAEFKERAEAFDDVRTSQGPKTVALSCALMASYLGYS